MSVIRTMTKDEAVPLSEADIEHAIEVVSHDLKVTTGRDYKNELSERALYFIDFVDVPSPISLSEGEGWTVDGVVEKLAEEIQQDLHDDFEDTTWPQCPRHPNHPLWVRDGYWLCDYDEVAIARIGELGSS